MALEVALPKSKALTLSSLAKHDDIITDALLDRVYYWTTIRKNRAKYMAMRGIRNEEIADILRKTVIVEKDAAKAIQQILDLKGMSSYLRSLDSDTERDHFTRHLRKYVNMYLPDCPFEINTTNRYTITNFEAAATARKQIKKGDVIKYLSGIQVPMTKEEENNLDLTRRDFSIVMSSRKKTPSLFLGPARFANHDCNANARLSTRGSNGMQIVAVRDIQVDEEITVSYGQDYFGEDNCECLCGTCEQLLRNGWDPEKKEDTDDEDEDMEDGVEQEGENIENEPYGFRRKRKYTTEVEPESSDDSAQITKKSKTSHAEEISTPTFVISDEQTEQVTEPFIKMERTNSDSSNSSLPPVTEIGSHGMPLLSPHRRAMQMYLKNSRDSSSTIDTDAHNSPRASSLDGAASNSTAATSPSIFDDTPLQSSAPENENQVSTEEAMTIETENQDNQSVLTDLSSTCEFDDTSKTIVRRRRTRYQTAIKPSTASSIRKGADGSSSLPPSSAAEAAGSEGQGLNKRRPGDYVKTSALLSLAYSRWNTCTNDSYAGSKFHFPPVTTIAPFLHTKSKSHTPPQPSYPSSSYASIENGCERPFVQQDGYLTRTSCPRCERHSMLYGYAWPKTDKENKKDDEERITDHRTVHRFLSPDSERRKRNGLPPKVDDDDVDTDEKRRKGAKKSWTEHNREATKAVKGGRIAEGKDKKKKLKGFGSKSHNQVAISSQAGAKLAGSRTGRPPKSIKPAVTPPEVEKPVITKSGRQVNKKGAPRAKKEEPNKYKPSPWKGWVIVEDEEDEM
ncbi:MAG: Histone-lysine N-methyltransferase set9 [Bathelium mastoideum]|nr:MAG: Histone-lysine N-methyltransferase set9 [Bathelium mastoideum]